MNFARRLYALVYVVIAVLFGLCALSLTLAASWKLAEGLNVLARHSLEDRFSAILDGIGLLTGVRRHPPRPRAATPSRHAGLRHGLPAGCLGRLRSSHLNRSAEELEPEAMEEAKSEDDRVESA